MNDKFVQRFCALVFFHVRPRPFTDGDNIISIFASILLQTAVAVCQCEWFRGVCVFAYGKLQRPDRPLRLDGRPLRSPEVGANSNSKKKKKNNTKNAAHLGSNFSKC